MTPILTLTMNPSLDTSSSVDSVVAEHKLRCTKPMYEAGGGGLNVARALSRLGGTVVALWTCGGHTGEILRELLDAERLNHQPIRIARNTRLSFIVNETSTDQQFRFQFPGPSMSAQEIDTVASRTIELKGGAEYLVLSGSLPADVPDDFYARIAKAPPASCRVIVDTRGPALRRALEAGVFLVKPNLRELGELAGRPIDDDAQVIATSRAMIECGQAQVVVTSLGAAGAMLVTVDRAEAIRSPTVPIRSKVGAGDSMVAAMTLALSQGWPTHEAARFGVAAGAAAVMTPGTQLCRREDVEQLYRQMSAEA